MEFESYGTALLQCACNVELLISTRWSWYASTCFVLFVSFAWLMNECNALSLFYWVNHTLSEPYSQLSNWVIPIKWWAEWACWSWFEWSHFRKKFSFHERPWPVKLTQWNRPSVANLHHTSLKKSLLKSILHVFQSLAKQECKMLLLLLRRHLFVLSGKKHFSQLFSYTALHNPLPLLPTPHCNYLTESEGMSRWSVKFCLKLIEVSWCKRGWNF